MYDKWYLKDWNLKVISQFFVNGVIREYGDGYKLTFGCIIDPLYKDELSNRSFMIFDNGGELNIYGLGFVAHGQSASMPLPVDGAFKFSNEDTVAYRIMCWITGDEIDYNRESPIDEDMMEALK
jgi:hypothetical protein